MLDNRGFIAEGVAENFFMIQNGKLYTPKLGTILAGITRDTIMQLASHMGIDVIQTDLTIQQVYMADEAFFTGTAAEVTPLRSLDDNIIGKDAIGPITQRIKDTYNDIVRGKDPAFLHFLTPV